MSDSASFTRAAETMHIAQPALSSSIRKLEAELGIRLFDRTSRRVAVTDAGAAFVARARVILAEVDALTDEMAEFAGAARGRVRVSIWFHLDPDLPSYVQLFIRHNPKVQVSILEMPASEMLDHLRRGDLDIAVPLLSPGLDFSDIEWEPVREERAVAAVALTDPLASATTISVRDLAKLPLICPQEGTSWRSWFDQAFAPLGGPSRIVIETTEISASLAYAALGIGVAVLSRRVIEALGRPVAILEIEGAPSFVTAVAWSRSRYRGPAASALLAHIRSFIRATDLDGPQARASTG